MKKIKKLMMSLMLCLMSCMFLVACSGSDNTTTTPETTPENTNTETTTPTPVISILTENESKTLIINAYNAMNNKNKLEIHQNSKAAYLIIKTPDMEYYETQYTDPETSETTITKVWTKEESGDVYDYKVEINTSTTTYKKYNESEFIHFSTADLQNSIFISGHTVDGVSTITYLSVDDHNGETTINTCKIKNGLVINMEEKNEKGEITLSASVKYDDEATTALPELPTLDSNNQPIIWTEVTH